MKLRWHLPPAQRNGSSNQTPYKGGAAILYTLQLKEKTFNLEVFKIIVQLFNYSLGPVLLRHIQLT
jgi:hypothetical protein